MENDRVESEIDSHLTCTICYWELKEPLRVNCNHVFCKTCLLTWIKLGKRTCPMCWQEMKLLMEDTIEDMKKEGPIDFGKSPTIRHVINKRSATRPLKVYSLQHAIMNMLPEMLPNHQIETTPRNGSPDSEQTAEYFHQEFPNSMTLGTIDHPPSATPLAEWFPQASSASSTSFIDPHQNHRPDFEQSARNLRQAVLNLRTLAMSGELLQNLVSQYPQESSTSFTNPHQNRRSDSEQGTRNLNQELPSLRPLGTMSFEPFQDLASRYLQESPASLTDPHQNRRPDSEQATRNLNQDLLNLRPLGNLGMRMGVEQVQNLAAQYPQRSSVPFTNPRQNRPLDSEQGTRNLNQELSNLRQLETMSFEPFQNLASRYLQESSTSLTNPHQNRRPDSEQATRNLNQNSPNLRPLGNLGMRMGVEPVQNLAAQYPQRFSVPFTNPHQRRRPNSEQATRDLNQELLNSIPLGSVEPFQNLAARYPQESYISPTNSYQSRRPNSEQATRDLNQELPYSIPLRSAEPFQNLVPRYPQESSTSFTNPHERLQNRRPNSEQATRNLNEDFPDLRPFGIRMSDEQVQNLAARYLQGSIPFNNPLQNRRPDSEQATRHLNQELPHLRSLGMSVEPFQNSAARYPQESSTNPHQNRRPDIEQATRNSNQDLSQLRPLGMMSIEQFQNLAPQYPQEPFAFVTNYSYQNGRPNSESTIRDINQELPNFMPQGVRNHLSSAAQRRTHVAYSPYPAVHNTTTRYQHQSALPHREHERR